MLVRARVLILMIVFLASLAVAAGKKKDLLPGYVLKARTVLVIIDPDAGTPMTAPQANKTAQDDVEKALMKWGRLAPVQPGMPADLVITVRKGSGKIVQPTIGGEPTNDRPVIVQPTDSGVRIGVQQGRSPDVTQSGPQGRKPHPQMEAGPPDDIFVVYEGSVDLRPGGTPVWHYTGKNALRFAGRPRCRGVSQDHRSRREAAENQALGKIDFSSSRFLGSFPLFA
jgi:hypothetical protein